MKFPRKTSKWVLGASLCLVLYGLGEYGLERFLLKHEASYSGIQKARETAQYHLDACDSFFLKAFYYPNLLADKHYLENTSDPVPNN